jgi:hypothetical protein
MSKSQFITEAKTSGIYQAALFAAMAGVSLPCVQLWIRSI